MIKIMFLVLTMVLTIFSAPLRATGVFEDFENDSGGFVEDQFFLVSDGQLRFSGDRSDGTLVAAWMGGSSPGGWSPNFSHSNYFSNFDVSVDVIWKIGSDNANYGYGLSICIQQNSFGSADRVMFSIDDSGINTVYTISRIINGQLARIIDWTPSLQIVPGVPNNLSISKRGNELSFSINSWEIERLTIEGCEGGAVGLETTMAVDVAFDNFSLLPVIVEDFSDGSGGFAPDNELSFFYDGRYYFRGNGSESSRTVTWVGGYNPGGITPNPEHSNYFGDFSVSVEALWQGGSDTSGYGISVCQQPNSLGTSDFVRFLIAGGSPFYTIDMIQNGQYQSLVDWTNSPTILVAQPNELSITKIGNVLSFSINQTEVQSLTIDGCVGGGIALDASMNLDVSYDNFVLMDFPLIELTPTTPTIPTIPTTNQPPIASFSITPAFGEAPLTVSLDASTSTDFDGTITNYSWTSSDNQNAIGQSTTMTFSQVGNYTIELVVTDDQGMTSSPFTQTVTVLEGKEEQPPAEGTFHVAFQGLKDFYKIGEVVKIDLVQKVNSNEFEPVDLWVAIQMPNNQLLFKTDLPITPFSPHTQAYKKSQEQVNMSERFLEFTVPPGMGGDYIFYAAYVKTGENPVTNGLAIKVIATQKTTLANN